MKIAKRDQRILWIGGGLVFALLVVVYGVLPLLESMSEVEGMLDQKERGLIQRVRAIGNQAVFLEESEVIAQELNRLRSQLLDSPDPSIAQNELENIVRGLAEENGVVISRSTPMQEKKVGDRYSRISLQINVQSGMLELTNFLQAVSTHPKLLAVDEFYVTSFRVRDQVRMQPRMNISGFVHIQGT